VNRIAAQVSALRTAAILAACLVVVPPASLAADAGWDKLAPFFKPPAEFANDFGSFKPPLVFDEGRPVKSAADWEQRRREILTHWHKLMGPWPPLLAKPRVEIIESKPRETFTQHRVRVEVAAGRLEPGFILVPPGKGPFPAVLVPYYNPETSIGLTNALRDFALQLTRRGFVTLSIGSPGGDARLPDPQRPQWQPLSFLAFVAANCCTALAQRPDVDPRRIGVVGHSYGGKWAMFASSLHEGFACAVWSDGGIVWDEKRPNVNFWEPWYLGRDASLARKPGVPTESNPRTGAYKELVATGRDLHELHALMAPRPFLVSGGSEDQPERWRALNHSIAVNALLGQTNRVAMTNRKAHSPTEESNEQLYLFFEHFLKR